MLNVSEIQFWINFLKTEQNKSKIIADGNFMKWQSNALKTIGSKQTRVQFWNNFLKLKKVYYSSSSIL